MERILDDWIPAYVEYMKDTEFPKAYHYWNAISCIAGALQRKVFIRYGLSRIYPNMYIVLVGPSGVGKSKSMDPAIEIYRSTGLPVMADSITPRRMRSFMEESETKYEDSETHDMITHTSIQIFSPELVVLVGQRDMELIGFLTHIYDNPETLDHQTEHKGSNSVTNLFVNVLAACAPDWFPVMFPPEAIGGGFTSRVIFVYERLKAQAQSFPIMTEWHDKRLQDLKADLNLIATHYRHPFYLTEEARAYFHEYYQEQEECVRNGIRLIHGDKKSLSTTDPIFGGYIARRRIHILKLSMIFAASRGTTNKIEPADLEKGLKLLLNVETKMEKLFSGSGRSVNAAIISVVMEVIAEKQTTTRAEIMKIFRRDIDDTNIEIVENTLEKMGFMRCTLAADKRSIIYTVNKDWED